MLNITHIDRTERGIIKHGTFNFSTSYTVGGEACDPKIDTLLNVIGESQDGYMLVYDYDNLKMKAYWQTGEIGNMAELTGGDISALTFRVTFLGIGA